MSDTQQCGFFSCIAGMHHPACHNYRSTQTMYELSFIEFEDKEAEMNALLCSWEAEGEGDF